MKTAGMSDAVLPLTKKQKAISNVVMGVLFLAAGVIIVLASVGVIPGGAVVAAPTVLFAFGLSVLFSAVVAKNALSMWFAGVVLACGATSLVEMVSPATYGNLFPIYIAAPGVGCVFAIVFAEAEGYETDFNVICKTVNPGDSKYYMWGDGWDWANKAISGRAKYDREGTDGKTTVFIGDSFNDIDFFSSFYSFYRDKDALCLGIGGTTSNTW